jgi:hypothetical protein
MFNSLHVMRQYSIQSNNADVRIKTIVKLPVPDVGYKQLKGLIDKC